MPADETESRQTSVFHFFWPISMHHQIDAALDVKIKSTPTEQSSTR